jgi:hypothetical protein
VKWNFFLCMLLLFLSLSLNKEGFSSVESSISLEIM